MNPLVHGIRFLKVNSLPTALIDAHTSLSEIRPLFAAMVEQVEIENHDYCNRLCPFCSNVGVNRRTTVTRMHDRVFEKILNGLSEIDYRREVVWARYSEFMAHDSIYDRIDQTRQALPKALLTAHSNGDYLNRNTLARLERTGLDRLWVNIYPNDEEPSKRLAEYLLRRTGLTPTGETINGYERLSNSSVDVLYRIPHFHSGPTEFYSRGGLVATQQPYQRRSICWDTVRAVTVDFNGQVMWCCQLQSLAPEHAPYVVGDLSQPDYTLLHAYRDLAAARRRTLAGGYKEEPCKTCNYETVHRSIHRIPWVAALLGTVPGYHRAFLRYMAGKK
ncbi:MAG: radical SAM protein [Magnetococcales bacterium]|nr:radical SAM protein [Magnetococcales bacterium]